MSKSKERKRVERKKENVQGGWEKKSKRKGGNVDRTGNKKTRQVSLQNQCFQMLLLLKSADWEIINSKKYDLTYPAYKKKRCKVIRGEREKERRVVTNKLQKRK